LPFVSELPHSWFSHVYVALCSLILPEKRTKYNICVSEEQINSKINYPPESILFSLSIYPLDGYEINHYLNLHGLSLMRYFPPMFWCLITFSEPFDYIFNFSKITSIQFQ
jgi:hypothetical protein